MISFHSHRLWPLCLIAALLLGNAVGRCGPQAVYRVQLIEKNRQTVLTNEPVVAALEVDGTQVQSEGLRSDEQGIVDLTLFRSAHQKYFDEYGTRATWVLWYQERRTDLTKLWQNQAGLAKIQLDLGPVLVSGHFVDEEGQRVRNGTDVFPAELRSYLSSSSLSWNQQCRLYSSDGTGQPEQMVSNGIYFDEDGSFRFYVPRNRKYRFDWLGMRDLVLVNPTFTVAEVDVELKLSVRPRPYVLYGRFLDAASGQPVTESININGLDVHFFGNRQPKYAVFFDKPGKVELTIGAYVFQRKYREQTVTLDIQEPLQRHDFRLEPLEGSAAAIKFRIKINGPALEESYDVAASLTGGKYFFQSGEYRGENVYEFTVPQAGRYNLSLSSRKFTFEAPTSILIEKEQTLEVNSVAKDTWLIVHVVDEKGLPIGFPSQAQASMHEPRVNCVLLEEGNAVQTAGRMRGPYLDFGPTDAGGALRPDEKGEVRFLLSRGGTFVLRTHFTAFEDSRTPVEIATHQSKAVVLRLKARG
jgi:hypothetical protein